MKFHIVALAGFLLSGFVSFTQEKKGSDIPVYKVKKENSSFEIFPDDGLLFVGVKNRLIIRNIGKAKKEFTVSVSSGTVVQKDSVLTIVPPKGCKDLLLSVYEKKGEKSVLVQNFSFKVVPYPQVSFNQVKTDSFIHQMVLLGGSFKPYYGNIPGPKMKIVSFSMMVVKNGEVLFEPAKGIRLNQTMRDYVSKLPHGRLITFSDIKAVTEGGDTLSYPIFRLFLVKDPDAPTRWGM